ncbi:hypothetical protein LOD99_11171 [Oopsacas minuta]|uniref:Uncharacterized protein n=1 Tax=Oopsacas minuta TaxID=111878 RepID=A0AAV7K8Q3_9METZ|nr:hypothetical protein LOD99_11171 [Oopsacas minuta]
MQVERNLVLFRGVDSVKSSLTDLIFGQDNVRISPHGREVRASSSCLRIFETNSDDRELCLHILRSQTLETCFVVVIDITKSTEFVNKLESLKHLSDHLADWSYSLFGNCLITFTHTNELAAGVDKQQLVDREFGEILSLVNRRYMFVNSTIVTQENRDRVLDELLHLSKPILTILCYGNNEFTSGELQFNLTEEKTRNIPYRISIHHAPDLDLSNAFTQPVYTPELARLIRQPDRIRIGVSVFLILISLDSIFSQSMFDLITDIPNLHGLRNECSEYFWSKAVIAFDTNGHPNPEEMIRLSINGNDGIKNMVNKVGGKYVYLSQVRLDALMNDLLVQSQKVGLINQNNEFIGGGDVNGRALRVKKSFLPTMWNASSLELYVFFLSKVLCFYRVYVFPISWRSIISRFLKIFKNKKLPSLFRLLIQFFKFHISNHVQC